MKTLLATLVLLLAGCSPAFHVGDCVCTDSGEFGRIEALYNGYAAIRLTGTSGVLTPYKHVYKAPDAWCSW